MRNTVGQVTSITAEPPGSTTPTNVATAITYEPFGPVTGVTYGNGIVGTYAYDADYRATSRADKNGTTAVINLAYAYYTNDSVHTITDSVTAANTQTMVYDSMDRLSSAVSGSGGYGNYSWTWDPVSNVKTQVINGTTSTFNLTTGTNKLLSIVTGSSTENVVNTAAGNINTLKIGTTTEDTLTYNQANQLATATLSLSATYKYDYAGERLQKTESGSNPVVYQYGQAARELLSENDLHSGQVADYIYLNGTPIGEINPATAKFYCTHTDRLGTPQKLTDSTKAVDWNATYQPFGNTVSFSGTLTNQSIRLPGQYFDPETGMNHNGFRDYAGSLTRYVESDPIGLAGGMNTDQYAKNNPFKYIDTNGQDAYLINRCLSAFCGVSTYQSNPFSHTFVAITTPPGNVVGTYSWGNTANLTGWNVDQPLDILTASEAIEEGHAQWLGGSDMDTYFQQAYYTLGNPLLSHQNYIVTSNCETEAKELIEEATTLKTLANRNAKTPQPW